MCSTSFVDFLTDKLSSYSTKMKGDSFKLNSSSFLMSGNSNFRSQQFDPVDLLNGLMENGIFNVEMTNPLIPLKQPLGLFGGNYFSFLNAEKSFSPHLYNLVMDSYRYKYGCSDFSLSLSNNMLISQVMQNFFLDQSSEMKRNLGRDSKDKEALIPPFTEPKLSICVIHSTAKKSEMTNKCSVPNSFTLNLELANRKTKEMHKRSKKRRRRQKKIQQSDGNGTTSISDEDCNVTSPVSSMCLISEKTEFGCAVSVSHSVQMASNILSSFIIPVDSSSDDSEWESYDEIDHCDANSVSNKVNSNVLLSPVSSLIKPESTESKCFQSDCEVKNSSSILSSFVVPVENSSDDDSDWDSCETDIFRTPDFEFTGLFITNLCTPQTLSSSIDCSFTVSCDDDETNEIIKLRTILLEVNNNWNEHTKEVDMKPKSPSKVSFAPDDSLVEVFPVEVYERKGEWEIYATERLRFKRKIDELEKVLSPCLDPEHRSKVFKKLIEPKL